MKVFYILVLSGALFNAYCTPDSAAASGSPLCLPRSHALLALLSPSALTDALAAAGPLLTWAPLLLFSHSPATPHHAATRRVLLVCMLAWLALA